LETSVFIFILAVMLVLSASSLLQSSPKYRLKRAVWEVHTQLNYARFKAICSGRKMRVSFTASGYRIELYQVEKKRWTLEMEALLEGVVIAANNRPTFHPNGNVSNLASIVISNSWSAYKVSIAISGRIKIIEL